MRPIDADALLDVVGKILVPYNAAYAAYQIKTAIDEAPTIDAVPIADVEAWLLEIAYNCVGVQDDMVSCAEDLANRMDGLRRFSADRRNKT